MIHANDLIKRHGKQKFVEMATRSQPKQTGAYLERKRRWGKGTTVLSVCEHGKFIIRDGKPTGECGPCNNATEYTKTPDFNPYFNAGLGGWVESRSDEKRSAKGLGLREAG